MHVCGWRVCLIWPLNNQSIDVFQIFRHASVEMYEIFIAHLVSIQLNVLLAVSENKKLTMLAVCIWILIDIVYATPYISTSSFHI